jgi:hypothetical protein
LGVRIDLALRNGQRKQTNGIPIGPDASFIIGETILAAVDLELTRLGGFLSMLRFFDDYEITFDRASDAEDFLAGMHGALAEYNLQLNAVKTRIVSLPLDVDNPWRDSIRRFELGHDSTAVDKNLIGYFDYVFVQKRSYPNDPVVSYAISRLEAASLDESNWATAEALLLQAMSVEPDAIQQVAVAFARAYSNRLPINIGDLTTGLTLIIRRHASQGHGFEVSWALWLALSLNCIIDDTQASAVLSNMSDPVVSLLALDAHQRGLLPNLDPTLWGSFVTADQLEGSHWLLSYEASIKGWLPAEGGVDHIAASPFYEYLRQNRVSFYTRVRTPTRASIAEIPSWSPAYGEVSAVDDFLAILGDHP